MLAHNSSKSRRLASSVSLIVLIALVPAVALAQSQSATTQSSAASSAPSQTPKAAPAKDTSPSRASQAKTKDDSDDTTTVTITADKPLIEHKIDRDVYDVKQDPLAATGTAADVLNNVPAVTVDNDGTVSLRGNSGVQVYINGKKSAQMQGDSRCLLYTSPSPRDS